MARGSGGVGGADPPTVRREASVQGWAKALHYSQPSEIVTSVSGGGSVTFGEEGMVANPGTTVGDTAHAYSLNVYNLNELDVLRLVAIISPADATPFGDDYEIGITGTVVNADYGAYLDLTTGEYHAGATTAPATLGGLDSCSLLIIDIDFAANECRFERRGGVNERVTIADYGQVFEGRVVSNSNGNGESVRVPYMKEMYIGSKTP